MSNYLNRRNIGHEPIGDAILGGDIRSSRNRKMYDPVTAAISAGSSLIGGAMSASAAESAASKQAKAAKEAQDLQYQIWQTQNAQQAPVRGAGYQSLNTLRSMLPGTYQAYDEQGNPLFTGTGTGLLTQTFGPEQLKSNLAPNYEFMKNQGLGAVTQTLNATGGGSNIARGATKFAEDYASNAYQNAFNNFQAQQTNIYNRLAGIAGLGQQGQSASNTLAGNFANAATGLTTGGAAAQAAGTVGATNALTGGLSNAANTYMLSSLIKPSGGWSDQQASDLMFRNIAPNQG